MCQKKGGGDKEMSNDLNPGMVRKNMRSDNPKQVENTLLMVLDSKDFDCLRQVYIELIERCSSYIARDDISGFVNLGFKLDRAVRQTGFPKGWEDSEGNSVAQFQGIFQALRGLATDITTTSIDREAIEHLRRESAQRIILALRREGPLKYLQIRAKLRPIDTIAVKRSLEKLEEFDIVKQIGEFYELTFLGNEIAVTLSERLSSKLSLGIRNEIRVLRMAYAKFRKEMDEIKKLDADTKAELTKEVEMFIKAGQAFLQNLSE
ncbi:hypothetical protein CL633_00370 [bacterium]|nr:hypothetical protein [bacterium]